MHDPDPNPNQSIIIDLASCLIGANIKFVWRFALQVAILQAQLMQAKAQLACGVQGAAHSPASHQWPDSASISALLRQDTACSARRPGPLDDCFMPELMAGFRDDVAAAAQHCAGKVDAGELQYLAQAMMRSPNYSL
jgi:hypothetical protein